MNNDNKPKIGKPGAAKRITEMLNQIRKQPFSKKIVDILERQREKTKKEEVPLKKIAKTDSDLET